MRLLPLLLIVGLVGCRGENPHTGSYLAGIAIHQAMATVNSTGNSPDTIPDAGPDQAVCDNCGGQGWLGDGTVRQDCPDCDVNWEQSDPEPRQRHDPVLGENSAMTLTPYSDYAFAKSQAELGKKDFLAVILGEGQNDWLKRELAASEALLQGWVVYAGPVGDWLGPDGKSFSTPRVLVNPEEAATQNPTYIGHGAGSLVKFLKATKGR